MARSATPQFVAGLSLGAVGLFAIWLTLDSARDLFVAGSDIGFHVGSLVTAPIAWGLLRGAYLLLLRQHTVGFDVWFDPITFGGIGAIQLVAAIALRTWGGIGADHWAGTGVQGLFFAFAAALAWRTRKGLERARGA